MHINIMKIKKTIISILMLCFLAFIPFSLLASQDENGIKDITQQSVRRITGVVSDMNEPLIGVAVSIQNTTTGTITDIDGRYSIDVPEGAKLQFTMVGYASQIIDTKGKSVIDVVLVENTQLLDEVVVVGAVMKKSDLTGALSQIDGKTLSERPVTNINAALQGRVSGVFVNPSLKPSDDTSLKIRGTNTINSGSNPIYVVDGMVMENNQGGFNSINLNDVESVQVLKDASATALYGSRGANGVVVITTKKGRNGEGRVTYDGWVGFSRFANRPKTLNATQLADLRIDAFANGYMHNNPNADRQSYIDNTLKQPGGIAFSAQEYETYESGKSYDWLDQFTKTGIEQNHTLSFSSGSDKGTFYLSFGYASVDGLIEGTSQERYNGRINAEYNIKPWLKVGTNTGFNRLKDEMPSDDVFNKSLYANPLLDYEPYRNSDTRYTEDYLTIYYRAHNEESNNNFNPFNSQEITRRRTRNRLTSSNYINASILNMFNVRSTLSVDYADQSWFEFTPNNIQESIRHSSGDARAKHERWSDFSWQWDNTISFNNTFAEKHRVSAILGTTASRKTANYTKVQGERFASNALLYYNLGGAAAIDKTDIDSDFSAGTLLSYVLRANYSYDDRYLFTGTARYDGSSKFATDHRWGIFPSFSLAWNVTGESFMKEQKVFDQLKFRVGYGVVGNQDIPEYAYRTLYKTTFVMDGDYRRPVLSNDGLRGTPDITWEKQKQTNLGLDMIFLDSRLRLSVDGFFITNDDLLMKRSLATSSGYNETWQNIGSVKNKGIEFSLGADIIKNRDLAWTVSGNISFDKNNVNKLYENLDVIHKIEGERIQREGNIFLKESLNTIYTYKSGGIAQEWNRSEWQGINYNGKTVELGDLFVQDVSGPNGEPDGKIDDNDLVIVGKKDPKFYGGFSTDLSYKGISLSAMFTYSYGAKKISNYYESLIGSVGTSVASVDLLNRWTPENTDTSIPKAITNASGYNRYSPYETDMVIQNASYLRMSTLTLSYTFPKRLASQLYLDNLRLYFTGSNLFTVTPYKGLDPEFGDWGYPPSRMYVFGINISF